MTAAKRAKLEAIEEPVDEPAPELELVEIAFRGQVFTVPKDMDDWETETCLAWSRSVKSSQLADWVQTVKHLLGPEQWDRLQALGSKRRDTTEFLTAMIDTVNKDCVS